MAEAVLDRLTARNIFDLHSVVAVVTGGGTGIGLMITTTLVANGANVYIIGPQHTLESMKQIANTYNDAAEKTPGKGRIMPLVADVREKEGAKRLAATISEREAHGITVLFNNAGIGRGAAKLEHITESTSLNAEDYIKAYFDPVSQEDFQDSINVNAVGPYWLTLAFLPLLEKWKNSEGGKKFVPQVVMTSSMNGWTKDPATGGNSFPYLYSKSAIGHATATLAHELLPLGIRVNGIAPGWFHTEMTASGTMNELGQSRTDRIPRFEIPTVGQSGGTNKDMGSLALMLVANWFINGETVLIDGGTLLKHPSSW